MKKPLAFVAAMALAISMTGCNANNQQQPEPVSQPQQASAPAETAPAETTAAVEQTVATINWTEASGAEAAAKGAGFETFGVMNQVNIGSIQFKSPKFFYTEGVAQAQYETGAAMLTVRKAQGKHTAPLTDRDKTEFPQKWTTSCEGLDVALYGQTANAATVMTWTDGTKDYGVTIQGLGGEELSMTPAEAEAVVKGIKDAEALAAPQPQPQQQAQPQSEQKSTAQTSYISADEAKRVARESSGIGSPETITAELKTGGDAPHYVVTLVSGNETHVIEIDAITGDYWSDNLSIASGEQDFISEDAAERAAIEEAGVGQPETVTAELKVGGDAPHYEVVLTQGNETHVISVDAYTAAIWSDDVYYEGQEDEGEEDFISTADAEQFAVDAAGIGTPDDVTVELKIGGDAPHYEVILTKDDETHVIELDAYTGDIWSDEVL